MHKLQTQLNLSTKLSYLHFTSLWSLSYFSPLGRDEQSRLCLLHACGYESPCHFLASYILFLVAIVTLYCRVGNSDYADHPFLPIA